MYDYMDTTESPNIPEVTVLMIVHNGENFLKEAIESILNQTYRNFEFLIIDDNSTDSSREIISSYKDSRIKIIENKQVMGLSRSLNKGLKLARGIYIARMSPDCISLPSRLEKQLELIKKEDFGMISCWASIINENRNTIENWQIDRENNSPEEIYYTLFFENCIFYSSCLFIKEIILKELGGYNEFIQNFPEYYLILQLSKISKLIKVKEVLLICRKYDESISFELNSLRSQLDRSYYSYVDVNNKLKMFKLLYSLPKINDEIVNNSPTFFVKKDIAVCGNKRKCTIIKKNLKSKHIISAYKLIKNMNRQLNLLPLLIKYKNLIFYRYADNKNIDRLLSNITKIDKKINILFIVPYMVMGGSEKVNLEIIKNVNKNEFEFHFITTIKSSNTWEKFFRNHTSNIYHLPDLLNSSARYENFILKYIEKANINIIFISNSRYGYYVIPKIKRQYPNVKIIDLTHGEGLVHRNSTLFPYIYKMHKYFDKRITISNHLKKYLISTYSLSPEKFEVIRNGIDVSKNKKNKSNNGIFRKNFNISENDFVISYIGRFSEEKHPEYFIEVANQIINYEKKSGYKFLLAGNGYLFEKVQSKIIQYNLLNYVFLTGSIENVEDFLRDSDVLLITSDSEGIPLVILEAMSFGVPVISTNVGAISEVIENNLNGFLVDYNIKTMFCEFVEKIYLLNNSPEIYKRISEEGIDKVSKDFSLNRTITDYENLFISLLHN